MNANKESLDALFESFKNMIRTETVVGEAVQMGDAILVPFVDVTVGFGGSQKGQCNAGGAKMQPSAVLVIKGERVELFNIKGSAKNTGFDRLIGMIPDIVSKLKKDKYIYINEDEQGKAEEKK